MPVRPRRRRRSRVEWSPAVALALTIGPHPGDPLPGEATLREAWEAFAPHLLATEAPGRRPWGWWRFDRSVPEALRASRPMLAPVENAEQQRAEADALEERRAAWLTAHEPAARHDDPGGQPPDERP